MMETNTPEDSALVAADRDLARRVVAGDTSAFETFFERHVHGLYRYVAARLRDPESASDVVQSVFAEALANLASFRGDGPLAAWLYGICRFQLSAHTRRQRRRPSHLELVEEAPEILLLAEDLPGALERPDLALDRLEITARVHAALDQLPERYAATLEWKYLDDLSVKEIARRLATSPKAAESLLARAREAFRRCFSRGDSPPAKRSRWRPRRRPRRTPSNEPETRNP